MFPQKKKKKQEVTVLSHQQIGYFQYLQYLKNTYDQYFYTNQKKHLDYESMWITREGESFKAGKFKRCRELLSYIYNTKISISESQTYRRGMFTKYMSENLNKFYSMFGYDDSQMIFQMVKSFNTGEDCIKKSYCRF